MEKSLSEWKSSDIVAWISGMEGFDKYADSFALIKDFHELSQFTKEDLGDFGLPKQFALVLHNRIKALASNKVEELPPKTHMVQASHYSHAK